MDAVVSGNPTFSINGSGLAWGGEQTFEYEEGMVWGAWIYSGYNTYGSDTFSLGGSQETIWCGGYAVCDFTTGAQVTAGDVIDGTHTYTLQY